MHARLVAGALALLAVGLPTAGFTTEFTFSGETVTWTAPQTGLYAITAWGARGGGPVDYPGGEGAEIGGYATLNAGTILTILVGGRGGDYILDFAGGGGGGSFVTIGDQPLVVAAGGGGAGGADLPGLPGLATSDGGSGNGLFFPTDPLDFTLGGAGGTAGNGGQDGSRDGAGFGGGGFYTAGQPGDPPHTRDPMGGGGHSFVSGGLGGLFFRSGYGGHGGGGLPGEDFNGSFGGFGGGGAGIFGGGGGGGYSGGGGGGYRSGGGSGGGYGGGGGGSYLGGGLRLYVAVSGQGSYDRYGNGAVRISSVVPEPSAWSLMLAGFAGLGIVARRHRRLISTKGH